MKISHVPSNCHSKSSTIFSTTFSGVSRVMRDASHIPFVPIMFSSVFRLGLMYSQFCKVLLLNKIRNQKHLFNWPTSLFAEKGANRLPEAGFVRNPIVSFPIPSRNLFSILYSFFHWVCKSIHNSISETLSISFN